MKRLMQSIGPAIIVASVVLGPGSILTSSKVGATFGLVGVGVVVGATVLMIGMVALAARLGVVYERTPCGEVRARMGGRLAVGIGGVLFVLVALFQSSNNIALIGGLEPMLGDAPLGVGARATILLLVNALIVGCLYRMRNLYSWVERSMKLLMALMSAAFLLNFAVAFWQPRPFEPVAVEVPLDWLPLLGLIGTTFSVAGAFYQAYLVREKGWTTRDLKRGQTDAMVSISALGLITMVLLLTGWRLFHGRPDPVELASVGDVARQLEPLFGPWAKMVFCLGILGGALSSFLVNAMVGGTVMSDALGKGSRLDQRWPLHFTTLALLAGMGGALASLANETGTVHLITLAQALTVLGIPALAATLLYLGTRPELTGERVMPRWVLALAAAGLAVSCGVAVLTAMKVWDKVGG